MQLWHIYYNLLSLQICFAKKKQSKNLVYYQKYCSTTHPVAMHSSSQIVLSLLGHPLQGGHLNKKISNFYPYIFRNKHFGNNSTKLQFCSIKMSNLKIIENFSQNNLGKRDFRAVYLASEVSLLTYRSR